MKSKPLSVGVAGIGYMASHVHLPILSRARQARLIALCDTEVTRAQIAAARFRIPKVYSSLEEMLSSEHLDLVDICLPPQKHRETLVTSLKHKVSCLIEKPLAVTTAEADEVIALASTNKVKVFVVHNYSAVPAWLRAKRLVTNGAVGRVIGVHINHFVSPVPRYLEPTHWCHELPGEYFSELLPHLAMLAVEVLGPVDRVEATGAKLSSSNSFKFDELRIMAQTAKGVGTISCSLNCPAFILAVDIIGTRGAIYLSGDYQAVVYQRAIDGELSAWGRGWLGIRDILARSGALARTSANVVIGRYTPVTQGHRYLIQRCLQALQGKGDYPIDISLARESVRLLEMAFGQIARS